MLTIQIKKHIRKGAPCLTSLASLAFLVITLLLSTSEGKAQNAYQKNKARHFKSVYKSQINYYANACNLLDKKKHEGPRHNARLAHIKKAKYRSVHEVEPGDTNPVHVTAKTEVKPEPVNPTPVPEVKTVEAITTANKVKEDLLPAPTSAKQEKIRSQVARQIQEKKDAVPLDLAPLYFNFNEDEFSVVDMEPFLVAVEYAIQGKHVLIEGHTDSRGADTYNVQLSIKRVQKIRQLMIDMGVSDDRISVVGYGEEQSAKAEAKNDNDHQNHRRVDFKVF